MPVKRELVKVITSQVAGTRACIYVFGFILMYYIEFKFYDLQKQIKIYGLKYCKNTY